MKLIIIALLFTFNSHSAVDDYECLVDNFSPLVSHKGQPFGLFKTILKVEKQGCVITIDHEKYKYLKNRWIVDVCREPVHIKQGVTALEVIKREGLCSDKNLSSNYCESVSKILSIIQDDGLIFAEGEKENIKSDHGQVYCTFLLLKKYLKDGMVLNKGDDSLKLIIKIDKPFIKQEVVDRAPRVDDPSPLEERKKTLEEKDPSISF